ncbi:cytosolic protein [Mesobacillus harenae]|uniref:cytosolic protein n=1 Tax=Mesobacillus harenae TaxID=2213203 RepID=UPI0015800488|nr:cytosolic protein [Mesobacillus harenae]
MTDKEEQVYTDFSNVETLKNFLTSEEFPEGPFGSPIRKDAPVQNKADKWEEGQRFYTPFNYEFKNLHQNLPRQMEGAHPTHDDPDQNEEPPYGKG